MHAFIHKQKFNRTHLRRRAPGVDGRGGSSVTKDAIDGGEVAQRRLQIIGSVLGLETSEKNRKENE